jgi:hypothetical protein
MFFIIINKLRNRIKNELSSKLYILLSLLFRQPNQKNNNSENTLKKVELLTI